MWACTVSFTWTPNKRTPLEASCLPCLTLKNCTFPTPPLSLPSFSPYPFSWSLSLFCLSFSVPFHFVLCFPLTLFQLSYLLKCRPLSLPEYYRQENYRKGLSEWAGLFSLFMQYLTGLLYGQCASMHGFQTMQCYSDRWGLSDSGFRDTEAGSRGRERDRSMQQWLTKVFVWLLFGMSGHVWDHLLSPDPTGCNGGVVLKKYWRGSEITNMLWTTINKYAALY